MKKTLFYTQAIAMSAVLAFSQSASASITPTPWVGTATYGSTTTPLFDTYDFGAGVALIDLASDGTFTGTFQTYINEHQRNGSGVAVANLNSTGIDDSSNPDDFELTMVATFSGTRTSAETSDDFEYTFNSGGTATLYYDSTPDHSFTGDSGFTGDLGDAILSGTIQSGGGSILSFGFGVQALDLGVFGPTTGFNPSTIIGGTVSMLLLTGGTPGFLDGITSVNGIDATGESITLIQTDGNLTLTAVPIPPAFLLFFSAAITLVATGKRRAI